jgi:hypothetical protein
MKASELIAELQEHVDAGEDFDVYYENLNCYDEVDNTRVERGGNEPIIVLV